jgi:hypothetical protein
MKVSWQQVRVWRMERQHLTTPAARADWRDVVSRIGGLQAQLLSSAELSVWARVERFEPDTLDRALWEDRTMVKLWAQRGTLHVLPSAEFGVWQAGFTHYQHYRKPRWYRYFELTERELDKLIIAIATALEGRTLTREELAAEVRRITRSKALGGKLLESWGSILKPASFLGHLCFAPNAGRNVRFTNPKTWLRPWDALDAETAMSVIARRYLAAYGPASRVDLAHWFGITPAAAGSALKRLGDEIVEIDVEGTHSFLLKSDESEIANAEARRSVRLLPGFDPYVIAVSPHALHCLPGDFRRLIYRPQGWISAVLMINGRMDGVWRWEKNARRLIVTIEPFMKLPSWAIRLAESEAERLAGFFNLAPEVRWNHD